MEIKKKIGKVLAAVLIGFTLMVLYTNAFPLTIKTGTGWIEAYYDAEVTNPKKLAKEHPLSWKYNEKEDKLYRKGTHYIYWKGFDIHYN